MRRRRTAPRGIRRPARGAAPPEPRTRQPASRKHPLDGAPLRTDPLLRRPLRGPGARRRGVRSPAGGDPPPGRESAGRRCRGSVRSRVHADRAPLDEQPLRGADLRRGRRRIRIRRCAEPHGDPRAIPLGRGFPRRPRRSADPRRHGADRPPGALHHPCGIRIVTYVPAESISKVRKNGRWALFDYLGRRITEFVDDGERLGVWEEA